MDNPNTIESSGAFGIPKWIMRKGMRYEVDDFIVSPPSNNDEGFMRLRYGRCPSPRHHLSPLDGAQADLGMTVEVKDGGALISGARGNINPDTFGDGPTISFGPGVLSAESTPFSTPLSTPEAAVDSPHTSPLHLLPAIHRDTKITSANDDILTEYESKVKLDLESPQSSVPPLSAIGEAFRKISTAARPSLESILHEEEIKENPELGKESLHQEDSPDIISPDLTPKASPRLPSKVLGVGVDSITDSFRNISTTRPSLESILHEGEIKENSHQSHPQGPTPDITPSHTPHSSPLLQHRVLGIAMETSGRKTSAHSYFCTKPFQTQDGQQQDPAGGYLQRYHDTLQDPRPSLYEGAGGGVTLSSASTVRNQQLEDVAKSAQSLDPSKMIGKRRPRPKPSSLREMNFWAPTSM